MSASNHTYMTWSGSKGSGIPQVNVVRQTDRSFSPPATKDTTSLRRVSGWMNAGCAS